jgi:hypothetical protein
MSFEQVSRQGGGDGTASRPLTGAMHRPLLQQPSAHKPKFKSTLQYAAEEKAKLDTILEGGGGGGGVGDDPTYKAHHVPRPQQLHSSGLDKAAGDGGGGGGGGDAASFYPVGRTLELVLLSSWGDREYMGLTGLELLVPGPGGSIVAFPLVRRHLDAAPKDLTSIGHHHDPRTLDKLIDGVNNTVDDMHMWMIPSRRGWWSSSSSSSSSSSTTKQASPPPPPRLSIDVHIDGGIPLAGLRVWNFNKGEEGTWRGVKHVECVLDGHSLGRATLKKATGHTLFDCGQTILFSRRKDDAQDDGGDDNDDGTRMGGGVGDGKNHHHHHLRGRMLFKYPALKTSSRHHPTMGVGGGGGSANRDFRKAQPRPSAVCRQDFETLHLPVGFVFEFRFVTTWGDMYYIGLNGLRLYDEHGHEIAVDPARHVAAFPHSLNDRVLRDHPAWAEVGCNADDARVPGNLFDGCNDDALHAWLAPFTHSLRGATRTNPRSGGGGGGGGGGGPLASYPLDNTLYVHFDEPKCLSMVKIWNYRKHSLRGVREFELWIDGLLCYQGAYVLSSHVLTQP